jgi:glycosyltransferase involved in cell wall biosynthesis
VRREGPRVLHLATSVAGGAGIAAWRIHEALLTYGIDSHFLTQGGATETGANVVARSKSDRSLQKSFTAANRWVSSPESILFTPFSLGVVSLEEIARFEPDIVHVHNWYNFFDWSLAPTLAARGISIVATMHDERLLTGGCHYTLNCPEVLNDCVVCPQSRLPRWSWTRERRVKIRESLGESNTLLICPSEWLQGRVMALGLMEGNSCEMIPNCVSPALLEAATISHPPGRVAIGFVIGKAPRLLQGVLDELVRLLGPTQAAGVDILGAGDGPMPAWDGGRAVRVGRIDTDSARSEFWDRVDVGLFVTTSDNFPNTILEGLARGVPQVVPAIGGTPEAVQATGGGVVCAPDARAVAEGVVRLLEDTALREAKSVAAREGVRQFYAPSRIAEAYVRAYAQRGLDAT